MLCLCLSSEVIELRHRLQVSESDAKALEGRIHRWEGDLSVTASRERQLQQQMQVRRDEMRGREGERPRGGEGRGGQNVQPKLNPYF